MLSTFSGAGDGGVASPPVADSSSNNHGAVSEVSSSASFNQIPNDDDDGLELGLFLGTTAAAANNHRKVTSSHARILTAEDLAFMAPRSSPMPASSATGSSSSPKNAGRRAGAVFANPQSQTVVGWPPIRAYRMNSLVNHSKDVPSSNVEAAVSNKKITSDTNMQNVEESSCIRTNENKGWKPGQSFFVKVNMDGDPIGRKVDLNAHLSYETLAIALETMFPKLACLPTSVGGQQFSKLLDGSSVYSLTYEDKDGDWMLVGDVPWGMFLNTVRRLKVMRKNNSHSNAAKIA